MHLPQGVAAPGQRGELAERHAQEADVVLEPRRADVVRRELELEALRAAAVLDIYTAAAEPHAPASGLLHGHSACEDDEVRPGEAVAMLLLDGHQQLQGVGEAGVEAPLALRRVADARPVAPPTPIRGAERRGAMPSEADEEGAVVGLAFENVGLHNLVLGGAEQVQDVPAHLREVRKPRRRRGQRKLERLRRRRVLAEAPRRGPHVVGRQLVPGMREGVVQGLQVLGVLLHPLQVRPLLQRPVARQHAHVLQFRPRVIGEPLVVAPRTLRRGPIVAEELAEEGVAPSRRRGRPLQLEAAGKGVGALAAATLPRPRVRGVVPRGGPGAFGAGAVRLAEGVAAADERHCLAVVHAHPREDLADLHRAVNGARCA
mmetsp:Transcript_26602/g.61573  ORF Transcript_26602/g.61573 Transcript_26602/m.61573 type:complete len:373 (-) Transcript_26602:487-1605(-)